MTIIGAELFIPSVFIHAFQMVIELRHQRPIHSDSHFNSSVKDGTRAA